MAWCVGIDPGKTGAIALVGDGGRSVTVWDMPALATRKGGSMRLQVDMLGLRQLIDPLASLADLAVIELVGPQPRDGNAGAFSFGFSTAMVHSACFYAGLRIETSPPALWKRAMKVPGKSADGVGPVMKRAGDLFPQHAHLFRGPKGGVRADRAEAAMLALFGLEHLLRTS